MAVLVTGGAGYIGSHMVWALLDIGEDVVVVDRLSTGYRWAVPGDVHFYLGDINNQALLHQIFSTHAIDVIFHFAGSISVPDSVSNPLEYYLNNTVNTRGLIDACLAHDVRKMVFSSTAAVYGAQDSAEPVSEDARLCPENPYGTSKLMSEIMLRDCAAAHDFTYVALRYFNVAGADTKGRAGSSAHGANNLIRVACETALGKRESLSIFGHDYDTHDGTGVRDYIHVSDLADAHLKAMDYLRSGEPSLVANCGYGHGYSVLDVVKAIETETGRPMPIRMLPRRVGDIATMVANADKARNILMWQPQFDDLSTIISSALKWERSLPEKLLQYPDGEDQLQRLANIA